MLETTIARACCDLFILVAVAAGKTALGARLETHRAAFGTATSGCADTPQERLPNGGFFLRGCR